MGKMCWNKHGIAEPCKHDVDKSAQKKKPSGDIGKAMKSSWGGIWDLGAKLKEIQNDANTGKDGKK